MRTDIGVIAGYGFELAEHEVEDLLLARGVERVELYEAEYDNWLYEGIDEVYSDNKSLFTIEYGGGYFGGDNKYFAIINHNFKKDSLELQVMTIERMFVGKRVVFIRFGYNK